jgi:hypothetical protein
MIYPEFRPRPSRREMLKYTALAVFFGAMLILITFSLAHAILAGEIPVFSKHSHEVAHWAKAPTRFIVNFGLWAIFDAFAAAVFMISVNKRRELKREAAGAGSWRS